MKIHRKLISNYRTFTVLLIACTGLPSIFTGAQIEKNSTEQAVSVDLEPSQTNKNLESIQTQNERLNTTVETKAAIIPNHSASNIAPKYAYGRENITSSPVLIENTSEKDASGNYRITKIVKTQFKYPHVRIVEDVSTNTQGLSPRILRSFMVADHIGVKLQDGVELSRLKELASSQGYSIRKPYHNADYVLVAFPLKSTDSLEKAQKFFSQQVDEVAYAEADYLRFPSSVSPNDPEFDRQGYLSFIRTQNSSPFSTVDNIGAQQAWEQRTETVTDNGEEILVGIIDTPIYIEHEDLRNNIWQNPNEIEGNGIDDDNNGFIDDVYGWNFNIDSNVTNAADLNYFIAHGTHVAGIVGAEGNNGVGVSGVAWRTKLVTTPVFGSQITTGSEVAAATRYLANVGVNIINASLGSSNYMQVECDAVQEAHQAGILFVAAAGNGGLDLDLSGNNEYPAECNVANVVSVGSGSTRVHDVSEIPSSNYGAEAVDIIAPWYAYNTWIWDPEFPADSYGTNGGTSMSSPMVAGAAALLMAEFPELDHLAIKSLLMDFATRSTPIAGTIQSGMLNIARAMNYELPIIHADVVNISASSHDGNLPENTMDGDPSTRWSAFGFGETITFELSADEVLSALSIQWLKGDQRASNFSIESSIDGITWEQVFGGIYREESIEQSSGNNAELEYYPVSNIEARYVRITGYGNTVNDWNSIIEAVIYVYDKEAAAITNLALEGDASQSTTTYNGEASRAIDGDTNGAWSGASVTHTANAEDTWWQVVLDRTSNIDEIVIHNRTDGCCVNRLTNFTVEIFDNADNLIWSEFYAESPSPQVSINVNARGNKVRLSLNGVLSLAELEVFNTSRTRTHLLT